MKDKENKKKVASSSEEEKSEYESYYSSDEDDKVEEKCKIKKAPNLKRFQKMLDTIFKEEYGDEDDESIVNIRKRKYSKKIIGSSKRNKINDSSDEDEDDIDSENDETNNNNNNIEESEDDDDDEDGEDDDSDDEDHDDDDDESEDEDDESYHTEESDRKSNNGGKYIMMALKDVFSNASSEINEDNLGEKLKEDMADYVSEDEMLFMADKYERVEDAKTKKEIQQEEKKKREIEREERKKNVDVEKEYSELLEMKKILAVQIKQYPTNKFIAKALEQCKESINKLILKGRINNTKKYYSLIKKDNSEDEFHYFSRKLSNRDQLKIVDELKLINKEINFDKPHRLSILQSSMPLHFKATALKKLNDLQAMEGTNEYSKAKHWLDNFMRIPFGVYKSNEISISDGIDKCNDFIVNAKNTLDNCVYGLDDAKMQFMQMLGQWVTNPNSVGTAVGLYGPPGTGKTSIIKDGISKILGREFAFIALGGSGDGSFLEGHSYTYEGSMWGKIVQVLMDTKCMNPIIYFDELDKVSDTPKGQEIIGILTHLTDITQNMQFHDKYFSEIDFDLSKCLFVFSYNDEHAVNPILKDRMYKIKTKGYDTKEKIVIARKYMLPKIREQLGFKEEDVVFTDEILSYIVNNMTKSESGVRNMKRCLETIYSKLNLFRLVKPETTLFTKQMNLKVEFPITLTKKEIDIFVKEYEPINQTLWSMYV